MTKVAFILKPTYHVSALEQILPLQEITGIHESVLLYSLLNCLHLCAMSWKSF